MRRATVLVAVAALAAMLPVTASRTARAAESFTFYGSGWGHGLGMSQYGAYGLAQRGWGHQRILTHFYSRTRVGKASSPPARLRIGLLQSRGEIHIKAQDGRLKLVLGKPRGGTLVGEIPKGYTWTVRVKSGKYEIRNGNGKLIGGQLWGGQWNHLFSTYGDGARAFVPETGHAYARGHLELNLYGCSTCAKKLRLIAVVPSEQYLYGLAEVPSSWPAAALRAQATAGRTYAFAKAAAYGQHRAGCNCALYASTADQVYVGYAKEADAYGRRWVKAVNGTAGQVVTYQGAMIQAFYSSSSGGYTENNENVWGGTPIPYLRGVCDPGDFTAANPNRVWEVTMSADAVTSRLRLGIGKVTQFAEAQRGVSGRILTIVVKGTKGQRTISGSQLRALLGLKDDRVWVNANRNVTGEIRERYDQSRCGPGLPKTAQSKVEGGSRQRFETGAIYRNEGTGKAYWLRGGIYAKYRDRGESAGVLGMPRSGVVRLAKPTGCGAVACRRANFVNGNIYVKPGIGAHALWGPVLRYFLDHGGVFGALGFPTSDVRWVGGGTKQATFEGGTVTCSSGGACTGP